MDVEQTYINHIRVFISEMVQKAKSGHPGGSMGGAPIAHVLFTKIMNYSPEHYDWYNRDRFILSHGHCSPLQYIMLHLCGYDVSMEDLKNFRQLKSKTPGHPEVGITHGVEVSTGPLGQGICNAIGMAIAEKQLAAQFNRDGYPIFDHMIYAMCGDGCLEEGITAEAASLAGHLGLGNVIVLYDDNHITIDGDTNLTFTEDVLERFKAYNWHTIRVEDGDTNLEGIYNAIQEAKSITNQPSLIAIHTKIGYGCPLEGTNACHGAPIGWDRIQETKKRFGIFESEPFTISNEIYEYYHQKSIERSQKYIEWSTMIEQYKLHYPELYNELERRMKGLYDLNWMNNIPIYKSTEKDIATRSISGKVLNYLAEQYHEISGGSADLTPSNNVYINSTVPFTYEHPEGRYIHFGIREHAMGAICNGMYAYGGMRPFCATFFTFTCYMMGAIRMSAIQKFPILYIMTHDSIGVGEDGPTHQPIEHLEQIRSMPNITVIRPADANETVGAYSVYMNSKYPVVLALSRQNLPILTHSDRNQVQYGAYIIDDCDSKPDLIFIATGSEVSICLKAKELLLNELHIRVISMPCCSLYDQQSLEYKQSLFPNGIPILAVEAGSPNGWYKYAHSVFGINTYGVSAPAKDVFTYFHFTPEDIALTGKKLYEFYKNKQVPSLTDVFVPTF